MEDVIPQLFLFKDKQVRIVMLNDEPWFVLRDVCAILELQVAQVVESLQKDEKDEVYQIHLIDAIGRRQKIYVVSEPGLYSTIMRSHKQEAKVFKHWLTHDVLPSIFRNGGYLAPTFTAQAIQNPDMLIQLLKASASQLETYQEQIKQSEHKIKELAPKAEYADDVLSAENAQTADLVASVLGLTAVELNKWLVAQGYLYRQGNTLLPSAEVRRMQDLYKMIPFVYEGSDGTKKTKQYLKWTEKGKRWIIEQYKKHVMESYNALEKCQEYL
jgi:prophage antirepressor-like protein